MDFVNGFADYNAMVSEENKQVQVQVQVGCSDEKSSVRPKKKGKKQRKVPQRGLGVAQLERMRIEEQKKEEVGSSSSPLMPPAAKGITIPASSYNYEIPVPSFNFCPIVPDPILPSTWDFTPQVGGVDSSEFMLGFGFSSSGGSNLAAEKPLPYQKRQEKLPSMVKVSSTNSCSSGVSIQIEPPSNQIYLTNNNTAWPQEKRIVGMKRPLPFYFEHSTISPPASLPWNTNSPPQFSPCANNCYKSASWQDLCNYDSASTITREGRSPSSSGGMLQNETDNICYWESNIGYLDGGFLSLSPPSTSTISGLNRECYHFPQADGNAQIPSPNSNPLFEMEPLNPIYYSFLPEHQALSNCHIQREGRDEGSKILDLTLKL